MEQLSKKSLKTFQKLHSLLMGKKECTALFGNEIPPLKIEQLDEVIEYEDKKFNKVSLTTYCFLEQDLAHVDFEMIFLYNPEHPEIVIPISCFKEKKFSHQVLFPDSKNDNEIICIPDLQATINFIAETWMELLEFYF